MEFVYSLEELFAISKSPLCLQPDSLLSSEIWMVPQAPPNPNTRKPSFSKPDGGVEDSGFAKRVGHISKDDKPSRSKQDDIVLGPPKISFGASLAGPRKTEDDGHMSSMEQDGRLQSRLRDSSGQSLPQTGAKLLPASRSALSNRTSTYVRRPMKEDDGEEWKEVSSRNPRKSFGNNDAEKFSRLKEDDKNSKPDLSGPRDRRSRELPGATARRSEGSWRDRDIDRDRRENFRELKTERAIPGSDRLVAKTLEWMDSPATNNDGLHFSNSEFAQAVGSTGLAVTSGSTSKHPTGPAPEVHSIEEFQAWKAKMKAADSEKNALNVKEESENRTRPQVKGPTISGDGVDRFFGLMAPAISTDEVKELSSSIESYGFKSPVEGSRSSRFSSFFSESKQSPASLGSAEKPEALERPTTATSPKRDVYQSLSNNVPEPTEKAADPINNGDPQEDKEGFKRIIALLGSKPSRSNAVPVAVDTPAVNEDAVEHSTPPRKSSEAHHDTSMPVDRLEKPPKSMKDASNAQFLMGLMNQSSKQKGHPLQSLDFQESAFQQQRLSTQTLQQQQGHQRQQPQRQQNQPVPPIQNLSFDGRGHDMQQMAPPGLSRNSQSHSYADSARQSSTDPRLISRSNMGYMAGGAANNARRPQWGPVPNTAGHTPKEQSQVPFGTPGSMPVSPNQGSIIGSSTINGNTDVKSPQLNGLGSGQGHPPFLPGMVGVPNLPPGAALPPFPPNGMLPNFPFFGLGGPPPPMPMPPGFAPHPHMQQDPGINMPPPLSGMLQNDTRSMPPFNYGQHPPGLRYNGISPSKFDSESSLNDQDDRSPTVTK